MRGIGLTHFAEPYAAQGNIDARAASRAIGKPQLDPWDVFLRETLQNSWDARRAAQGGVTYSVDAFWPSESQVAVLRDLVFAERIPGSPLDEFLAAPLDEQPVLVVTDRGTKGLGGGTRADRMAAEGEPTDFVDFVRNVGRAAEKALGGGTYGFGKGILWQVSNCSTVLVYSRSHHRGEPVSRLIAIGHTDSYAEGEQRFTGRHWWGAPHPETKIEPLEGQAADSVAAALGMTRLGEGETGTAIMVLEPMASEAAETLEDIVERIAGAALWWAWPHMVDETIDFAFSVDGEPVEWAAPQDHPVLGHFAEAYVKASSLDTEPPVWPWFGDTLMMRSPEKRLGALAWRRVAGALPPTSSSDRVAISSHVALMRQPRLVVKYLEVKPDPTGQATVGVFIADGVLNDAFAKAEPVAHDDWQPTLLGLEKGAVNPVRLALTRIADTFKRAALVAAPSSADDRRRMGLMALSRGLGDMVGVGGDGSGRTAAPGRSSGGVSGRTASAHVVGKPQLQLVDGEKTAVFGVCVNVPAHVGEVEVTAEALAVSEGGGKGQHAGVEFRGWRVDGSGGSVAALRCGVGRHEVSAMVVMPPDIAVTVNLAVRAVDR